MEDNLNLQWKRELLKKSTWRWCLLCILIIDLIITKSTHKDY